MEARHAVLLAIQAEDNGRIVGRTLLQKKLFFAARLIGPDIGFQPHYYGPYSQEVADATDSNVVNRFIEEQVEVFEDSNVFGERRRHSYSITSDGQEILDSISSDPEIPQWQEAFNKINEQPIASDFNLLSIAAKVLTILTDIKHGTADDIISKAPGYGWKLTNAQVREVDDFLKNLGLTQERPAANSV